MKQVYINHNLKGDEFTHQYNIITDPKSNGEDTVTRLLRSDDKLWANHARNQEVARITDTGDELVIHLEDGRDGIILEYHQAEELFILLSQQEFAPFEIRESKTTMKWPLSL